MIAVTLTKEWIEMIPVKDRVDSKLFGLLHSRCKGSIRRMLGPQLDTNPNSSHALISSFSQHYGTLL
jgi:hypothetical protein